MTLARLPVSDDDVIYPETDGKPMAETDYQRIAMTYLIDVLEYYFEPIDDVYVSGNILCYYQEGDNEKSFSPDVLVACEVEKRQRPIYQIWEEGKAPDVIIEVTSKSTRLRDEKYKAQLYLDLGVREYFQYDPTGDYIPGGLKGRINHTGVWEPITPHKVDRMSLALECYSLDLTFCVDFENQIHVWSLDEQRFLPGPRELRQINSRLVGVNHRLEMEKAEVEEQKAALEEKNTVLEDEKARLEAENRAMKEKLKSLGML